MKRIFAALFVLLIVGPVYGQDIDSGNAAYDRGDYAEAAEWYHKIAARGYSEADAQSYRERHYPEREHMDGYLKAVFMLGYFYCEGLGVPQDFTEAAKWLRISAQWGDANSAHRLGSMYRWGQGVPQDRVLARMWFIIASKTGHCGALGTCEIPWQMRLMFPWQSARAKRMAQEWLDVHGK